MSDDSPVVPCGSARATSWTFNLMELEGDAAELPRTSDGAAGEAYQVCAIRYVKLTSSAVMSPATTPTILRIVPFLPNQSDWDRGARWVRCDLIAESRAAQTLETLPETVDDLRITDPNLPQKYRMCSATTLDTGGVNPTSCERPHTMVAAAYVPVPYGEPGDKLAQAKPRCNNVARAWPHGIESAVTPDPPYDTDDRAATCWAITSGTL